MSETADDEVSQLSTGSLKEKCRARGGTDDEHELLRVTAKSKQLASEQIEGLKQLEKQLAGAETDE